MIVLDQRSIKRFVFDSLQEIILPGSILVDPANDAVEAPQDPRFQIVQKMDIFVSRAADVSLRICHFAIIKTDLRGGIFRNISCAMYESLAYAANALPPYD